MKKSCDERQTSAEGREKGEAEGVSGAGDAMNDGAGTQNEERGVAWRGKSHSI